MWHPIACHSHGKGERTDDKQCPFLYKKVPKADGNKTDNKGENAKVGPNSVFAFFAMVCDDAVLEGSREILSCLLGRSNSMPLYCLARSTTMSSVMPRNQGHLHQLGDRATGPVCTATQSSRAGRVPIVWGGWSRKQGKSPTQCRPGVMDASVTVSNAQSQAGH